jgi:predicted CoA-binding protein
MARVVAIVGASSDRTKFGNKALRAFRSRGHAVIPIHPREVEVEGEQAYRSVLDVPGRIDMATLYVPAAVGLAVLDEIATKGIAEVWLNPGADSPEMVTRARALGLQAVVACSIRGIGEDPSRY